MRQLLTIFPTDHYSFCNTEQMLEAVKRRDLLTPEIEDFIIANELKYWDDDDIKDFVLAIYS